MSAQGSEGAGQPPHSHPPNHPPSEEQMAISDGAAKLALAQGVVSVQADCTFDDALRMMRDRAQIRHQSLSQIADGVVAHRIWFTEQPTPD
jgi:hypothetical protein